MESPRKKRKIMVRESRAPNAMSTPVKNPQSVFAEAPSMSGIEYRYSSFNVQNELSLIQSKSENALHEKTQHQKISLSDILDSTSNSSTDVTVYESDDVNLDYDAFFNTCSRFQLKGPLWQLYKPISSEEGLLYYQITSDPQNTPELAKWFVDYCKNRPVQAVTYILFKLYFDCSGFQKFNLEKYFTFPPKVEILLEKYNKDYVNKQHKTRRFLFEENTKLAKILKFGVYNFLQKFILEAHEKKLLYEPPIIAFIKLLTYMCKEARPISLVYTAYIFVIKILTAICMVKQQIFEMRTLAKENELLNIYINALYNSFSSISYMLGEKLSKLKVDCLFELNLWIQYSSKLFVDNFNCIEVLKQLLLDRWANVRLAALDFTIKVIQNDSLLDYLKGDSIRVLSDLVWERVSDVNIFVQLKAFEVMMTKYSEAVPNKKYLETLTEAIYHKDYRLGSAAGKGLIEILNREKDDDFERLLYLGKIAKKIHPNLKSLLVESCINHTELLQNWTLFIEILCDPSIEVETKASLSELLLESVRLLLKGRPSKVRILSILDRSIASASNELVADVIYPHLKTIIMLHRKDDIIIQSIFKILLEIAPDSLSEDHCEVINQLTQLFTKLFAKWDNSETLNASVSYLSYVNQHLPIMNLTASIIEDLKKYCSDEFNKWLNNRNNQSLIPIKKTSIVFKYFDLNEHIKWLNLLSSWRIMKTNQKFIEFTLAACHWSLIWKIRKLNSPLGEADLDKEISLILEMSTQFFNNCFEIMRLEEHAIKFKAFDRICETCITYSRELENISRQIRIVEVLKPVINDDILQSELMNTFQLSVDPSSSSDAVRVRKYIEYIYHMGCMNIIPLDNLSVALKFFSNYYESYGKILETILLTIHKKNENWIPALIVNSIALMYEDILEKYGVVDIGCREAKDLLSLSRRFYKLKKIMNSKIASQLLIYAVNYVTDTTRYDFLVYVRPFADALHTNKERKEIITITRNRIPESARRNDSVLYFVDHLRKPVGINEINNGSSKKSTQKAVDKKAAAVPKPKIKRANVKRKQLFKKVASQSTEESATSDQMSIHDTSSNDGEFVDLNTTN